MYRSRVFIDRDNNKLQLRYLLIIALKPEIGKKSIHYRNLYYIRYTTTTENP